MCDGDCAKCPFQCGSAKIFKVLEDNITTKEKEQTMAEEMVKVSGCGSPKEVEEVRQNAAIVNLCEKTKILFIWSTAAVVLTAVVGWHICTRLNELQKDYERNKLTTEFILKSVNTDIGHLKQR